MSHYALSVTSYCHLLGWGEREYEIHGIHFPCVKSRETDVIGPKEVVADLFTCGFLGPRLRLLKFRAFFRSTLEGKSSP